MKKLSLLIIAILINTALAMSQKVLSVRITNDNDDSEEALATAAGKTLGEQDIASSDVELGFEAAGLPQIAALRFAGITIPQGAVITKAYLKFTVDAVSKNADPCNLFIYAEDTVNPGSYTTDAFHISSRSLVTTDSVAWNIMAGTWTAASQSGADQTSSDIKSLVQNLVNRPNWVSGNAMAFQIKGNGIREAESSQTVGQGPLLYVEYFVKKTISIRITNDNDDSEEALATADGKVKGDQDIASSDIELGFESTNVPQIAALRFANISIPKDATIQSAYLKFYVDAIGKNANPSNLFIYAEDNVNPSSYTADAFHISSRNLIKTDSVSWNIASGTWTAAGQSGADQTSSDIKSLVNTFVTRTDWTAGNAMAFQIKGTGIREAESAQTTGQGPELIITYLAAGNDVNPTTAYPVGKTSKWAYSAEGKTPDASMGKDWKVLHYNDSSWESGDAAFGYGANSINKVISYGTDANNKYITSYFRKRFSVADLNALTDSIEMTVRADDGAIIYVNGTEVARMNMPAGAANYSTLASSEVKGYNQDLFFIKSFSKTLLAIGDNVVAVEIHQNAVNSTDLAFNMTLGNFTGNVNPTNMGCLNGSDTHIGCFKSLLPRQQDDTVAIPMSHSFQFLFKASEPYTVGGGNSGTNNDFTGYVPFGGTQSDKGYLSINHETNPGGVSILDIHLDKSQGKWIVDSSQKVDFSVVNQTYNNCSGTVTPWNTVITCEETTTTTDSDANGYHDKGWCVEINPVTKKVMDYGNGPEKLWKLGKMAHENVVVTEDMKTVYVTEDTGDGLVYKFVADVPGDLTAGNLYALKLDSSFVNNDNKGTTGSWVLVPNGTPAQCNNVKVFARDTAKATIFGGVEDAELSPIDSMVYFTVKSRNRVYRFEDNGMSVSSFITYVGGKSYKITSGEGVVSEDWGAGNDNLTFDDRGNLYVLQDGGRNHLWVVRPGHTQAEPKVEVFLQCPIGGEPTGMTFTPDYRYMFISMQEPGGVVLQADAFGKTENFTSSRTLVISRSEFMNNDVTTGVEDVAPVLKGECIVYPNPVTNSLTVEVDADKVQIIVRNITGVSLINVNSNQGISSVNMDNLPVGLYFVEVNYNGLQSVKKVIKK